MEKSFHNVSDLSADARSLVESLIGHPLPDHQAFYIVTLDDVTLDGVTLDDSGGLPQEQRDQAWQELEAMMGEMQRSVKASGRSDEEIDRLIDETCEEVRYGRKP